MKITIYLFFLSVVVANTQNLVPNPSFEKTGYPYFLPKTFSQNANDFETAIFDWQIPNRSTPEIITPSFKDGYLIGTPRTGQNMIGLSIEEKWFEYIQTILSEPLKKGRIYQAEFWVARSKNKFNPKVKSDQQLNSNFGILFKKEILKIENRVKPIEGVPHITCRDSFEVNTKWKKVSSIFTAKEAFTHFCIGEFITQGNKSISGTSGYVLIDDISIKEINGFNDFDASLSPGTTIPLRKVHFGIGSKIIKESSYPQLNKLVGFLAENQMLKIQINGHTDNTGDKKLNQELSKLRAVEIQKFLIKKGISKDRLIAKGFGESKPILPNTSYENKAVNRRVEFEILEN